MYDIKLEQGCGIKATMLTPTGGVCDLRRARYIAASLVLPSGATMNCEDIAFNEVTNGVYVRLLGTRELTTTGQYGIVFNVKLEDKTMYSTPVVWFAEVKEDAPTGYHELTLSLSLTVVNFPDNVSYTGASPKIGDKNTWLVYDDDLNAYVDTGIEVGYANLLSRYDSKFAEIVVPCTEATNAAAAATVAANNAAAAANSAAGSASTATAAANTAAGKANTATTAANNAATAANTAAGKANTATTAANNAATAANTAAGKANEAATAANNAAESAQRVVDTYDDVINTLAHSDCTLDERVEALERALISVLSGAVVIPKLQVKELNVWGDNNLAPVGNGAPTKAPDRAGQFYIDKTARTLYFSTGNAAVSDWKIQ